MAKRRKRKKSTKCPEPINTMIDIAGGIAMGAVASHMEKKYHYSKKGKPNPYTFSAMRIASGRSVSTKDMILLGAMGAFDVDADDTPTYRTYIPEDPVFSEIQEIRANDNRYAWRLNCEDGSIYGVFPDDYETRDDYNAALARMKYVYSEDVDEEEFSPASEEEQNFTAEQYLCLRLSRLDNGVNQYYRTNDETIKVGDVITVPAENGNVSGIVIAVEHYSDEDAPTSLDEMQWVLGK